MSDGSYWRPLVSDRGERLAGGWARFDRIERLWRGGAEVLPLSAAPGPVMERLTQPRADLAGLTLSEPRLMGIINATPDSFSDGGRYDGATQGARLRDEGADILDIGGESTRPGAQEVPVTEEINRVVPVLEALSGHSGIVLSIDTRKAAVARAALGAGAQIINDVAALTFDGDMAATVAESSAPVCLMHAQGDPETMQADPQYGNVLLDVYDWLAERVAAAQAAGIPRSRIIVDPGIGFGKTQDHNLALIRGIALFHGIGCPILLGASRKGFIGAIGEAPVATDRLGGTLAVFLKGLREGVQIARLHDIFAAKQAQKLHMAVG